MGEFRSYSPLEVTMFMGKIGYPVSAKDVAQTYPMFFPERRVFRTTQDEVIKVRPNDHSGRREAKQLISLFASYTYSGGHFSQVKIIPLPNSSYLVFRMPYLGRNFIELGTSLDLIDLGQSTVSQENFSGFTGQQISRLIDNLTLSQQQFASRHGIIHGDFMQTQSPNNVVYHSGLDRLFLIDAEALAPFTEKTAASFDRQMQDLEAWMCQNLLMS